MKTINKGLLVLFAVTLIMAPSFDTEAKTKTTYRYTTQTVKLAKGVTVKRNTRVKLLDKGKTRSLIEYKGKPYVTKTKWLHKEKSPRKYTPKQFRWGGIIRWHGCTFTYYSQRVLPGGGLQIPGRHVDKRGFVCDKDGYIVIASTVNMKKKHAVVATPFGKFGKVYDCGAGSSKWRDCFVAW